MNAEDTEVLQIEGKRDVKAIMAKFNTVNNPSEEISINRPGKIAGTSPFPVNSALQTRKAALEKFNSVSQKTEDVPLQVQQKPVLPKLPSGSKLQKEVKADQNPKPPYPKPAVGKLGNFNAQNKENDEKPAFPKPPGPKPSEILKDEPKPLFPKPTGPKSLVNLSTQEKEVKPLFPKPPGLKPFTSAITQEEEPKPLFPKPPGLKPFTSAITQEEEPKPIFPKPSGPKPFTSAISQEEEPKPIFLKPTGLKPTSSFTAQQNESKPLFPKPGQVKKPPWITDSSQNEENVPKNVTLPKAHLAPKPKTGSLKAKYEETEENSSPPTGAGVYPGVSLKSASFRRSQNSFSKESTEQNSDDKISNQKNIFLTKLNQGSATTTPSSTVSKLKAGFMAKQENNLQELREENKNSTTPKHKPLPNLSTLGQPPSKPNRPPSVNLENFRKSTTPGLNKPLRPPVPAAQLPPPLPSQPRPPPPPHPTTQPPAPNLPPRNIKVPDLELFEENYDDVGIISPTLPPGRQGEGLSNHGVPEKNSDSDGEMYEDLDEIRVTREEEKKREKEEKKKLEQEKKEQKEKEKKEQEIRKRFKLVGSIEVIHNAKASEDCKGGKYDLTVKQGEPIEIIRITDNPEGKWLGRTADGSYGFIKITCVDIDYDSLKRKPVNRPQQHVEEDQEVYDDIAEQDSGSGLGGGRMPLPLYPENEEVYDGIDDVDLNISSTPQDETKANWSWGLLKIIKGKDDKRSVRKKEKKQEQENEEPEFIPLPQDFAKDSGDGDIYDDVDTGDFPPPPPEISLNKNLKSPGISRGKGEEKDNKKLKKFEKEEKEFRKKFKYEGEIKFLYTVEVVPTLTSKKWGSKDLPLKPREVLEVIQEMDTTKVICRNDEGKYGYVLRSNIVTDGGDVYDDIGEGCIYDND
ncbi:FYN-binding protein 1 [Latimeria chalumnae]|uniref:FYN-binding protein 1 n=1 Tax=Latimeria chalumnae TaxID=7897 RepID=UPI0006D93704|nr:PREDICTED: FYN-binding protein [Latimeria chalumnae]|eukprot:XP_014346500.1 PREDICTED: FYN-binding protein [Latimeria chalumnae]